MFNKIFVGILFILIFVFVLIIPAFSAGNVCPVCTASWVANAPTDNVLGYKVYLTTVSGAEPAGVVKDVGNVLTSVLSTSFILVNGTQYYIKITAYNVAGESLMSNEIPFIFINAAPSAPTGLIVK